MFSLYMSRWFSPEPTVIREIQRVPVEISFTNPTPYSATQITIQNPLPTTTTSTQQYCVLSDSSNLKLLDN